FTIVNNNLFTFVTQLKLMNSLQLATHFLVTEITKRYVTLQHIKPFMESLSSKRFSTKIIGHSVLQKPIYSISFGKGKKKVLMWSQMHGNESTTTKGVLDFINFLQSNNSLAQTIYNSYTVVIIPILNPDGAELYTRENANKIDLNRDAKNNTQPESKVLRAICKEFQPDLCLNLHDQRTIFGTENTGLPATMSFLAPAYNATRDYNETRLQAVQIINTIANELSNYIPNQIGRFDDSFNDNCIGDYLMTQNVPTILFEAGHFQNDYQRDEVRKFVFIALLQVFSTTNENVIVDNELDKYLKIPQNKKCFYDFYYKNIKILDKNSEKTINFAAHYEEHLVHKKIEFVAKIVALALENDFYGHFEYDGKEKLFECEGENMPKIGKRADFSLANTLLFRNGLQQINE
ncbi:M14 metallopeptidase family protein, partial [Flavobacterium sp.]|uniref:M14 family metallopeptidase n=1 Tax=Flavobacterium sp. TaxID=239 RepID=UPI0035284813